MTRKSRKQMKEAADAAAAAPEAPAEPTPTQRQATQRQATPEEAQQLLAQQRGRAEVAVLKQRFAETDVAMTIAQAECAQLVQQNQILQQENERLKGELADATKDTDKQPGDAEESED